MKNYKLIKMLNATKLAKIIISVIMLILVQITAVAQTEKLYPTGDLNLDELRIKFFQLCDIAVRKLNLPERQYSQDTPKRRVPFYADAYAVRSLAVAYDLTGNEEYLNTIKTWADRMITNQNKMIPKGGYYMNYGRKPFETKGEWYVADCAEISMGMLATAARCKNPMEKDRYIKSVESFANLVMENYIGEYGGINDGLWSQFNDECNFVVGYAGQVFFKLYDETGNAKYLETGLNAVNWLNNYDWIRQQKNKDSTFLKFNPPLDNTTNSSMIRVMLDPYSAGLTHIFSGQYPEIEEAAREKMKVYVNWFKANLMGKGESGTYEKYDIRRGKVGGKFGGLPFHIYVLTNNEIIPNDISRIADKELHRIVAEIFSYDEQLLTEFTMFSMMSMAEKLSPGSVLRNSKPLYKIIGSQ